MPGTRTALAHALPCDCDVGDVIAGDLIEQRILLIRGQNVMLDRDLANLYGVEQRYDAQFKVVFDAIRQLMSPAPLPLKRRIGFVGEVM